MIKNIIKDKRGATTTEYAILIGLLALIVLGAVQTFGKSLKTKVESQAKAVDGIGKLATRARTGGSASDKKSCKPTRVAGVMGSHESLAPAPLRRRRRCWSRRGFRLANRRNTQLADVRWHHRWPTG